MRLRPERRNTLTRVKLLEYDNDIVDVVDVLSSQFTVEHKNTIRFLRFCDHKVTWEKAR